MKRHTRKIGVRRETIRQIGDMALVVGGAPSKLSGCCSGADPICNVTVTC